MRIESIIWMNIFCPFSRPKRKETSNPQESGREGYTWKSWIRSRFKDEPIKKQREKREDHCSCCFSLHFLPGLHLN
jgi:hypothetical protein